MASTEKARSVLGQAGVGWDTGPQGLLWESLATILGMNNRAELGRAMWQAHC